MPRGSCGDDAVRHHPRRRLAARSVQPSSKPSFASDIGPIFSRLAQNQWVNAGFQALGLRQRRGRRQYHGDARRPSEYARPLRESWFARFEILRSMSLQPIASHRCTATARPPTVDPREWYATTPCSTTCSVSGRQVASLTTTVRTRHRPRRSTTSRSPRSPGAGSRRAREHDRRPFHPGCEMT